MKEDQKHTKGGGAARGEAGNFRTRVRKFRGEHERSFLGVPEIVALAAAGLLLAAALASYFLLLRPQRARLASLADEQSRLERGLREAKTGVEQFESTQASVEAIIRSLDDFETKHLGQNTPGSTAIIAELNRLIRRHSLRISGGLAFTQFEVAQPGAEQQQRQQTAATSKPIQDVFPGVGISISVEGTYPSLRRFIRDVEADPQFIVINSVELEGVTDTAARPVGLPGEAASPEGVAPGAALGQAAPARGTLVSLRLDMAAYFRRAAVAYEPPAGAPSR